jgi:hypothetical protein
MAELLAANALLAAREGRHVDALADVASAVEIVNRACRIPGQLDVLVLYDAAVTTALEEVVRSGAFRGEQAHGIVRILGAVDFADVALKGLLECQASTAHAARFWLERWLTSPVVLRARAADLRHAAEMVAACRRPSRDGMSEAKAAALHAFPPSAASFGGYELYVIRAIIRAHAGRDVVRVGLAIELFRSERGAYPETLDALAPGFLAEVPPDPYTGKPLRYLKRDGGFVVYSVGSDLADDGGRRDPRNPDLLDIPWTGGARDGDGGGGTEE